MLSHQNGYLPYPSECAASRMRGTPRQRATNAQCTLCGASAPGWETVYGPYTSTSMGYAYGNVGSYTYLGPTWDDHYIQLSDGVRGAMPTLLDYPDFAGGRP